MSGLQINVREARTEDSNDLMDIDIKCFDNPWTGDDWSGFNRNAGTLVYVAAVFGTPIGFIVFQTDQKLKQVEILKIAVKDSGRQQGASRQLLMIAEDFAIGRKAPTLTIVVPESSLYTGPLGKWLTATGFQGTKPFIKNRFVAYGESEDGVKFIKSLIRSPQ